MPFNLSMFQTDGEPGPHGREQQPSGFNFSMFGDEDRQVLQDKPLEDALREHGSLQPEDKRSGFARGVDALFSAPKAVTDYTQGLEAEGRRLAAEGHPLAVPYAQMAGLASHLTETFVTPGDALLTATGLKAVRDAGRGVSTTARALEAAGAAGLAGRGVERIADAESGGEAGVGALQALLGIAGVAGAGQGLRPQPQRPPVIRGRLVGQTQSDFVAAPGGVVGRPGDDIPLTQAPDGSYVRAEPAEYARREPRGLLPAGPRFIADDTGHVAGLDDAGQLAAARIAPEAPPPQAEAPKGKRGKEPVEPITTPAAVVDRHLNNAPIFSSDPAAVSVKGVPLDAAEAVELRGMLAEMDAMPFTKHTFLDPGVGRGGSPEIVPGGGGASVYQDIVDLYGGSGPGRQAIMDAMQKLLDGQPSTYGPVIREVARLRLNQKLGRELPPDAGVRNPRLRGDMSDSDFEGFSQFLDDQATLGPDTPPGTREPGQEGFINPAVLHHLGAGTAGAVAGGATGDDPESRLRGALAGGLAGLAGSAAVGAPSPARGRGLATLGDQLAAKGVTPDTIDPRLSGIEPTQANRPTFGDPLGASYERVLKQGGRTPDRVRREQLMRGILSNQAGTIDPVLAAHLGSGAVGAATGAATGDDAESRVRNAILGGIAGVAAPGVVRATVRAPGVIRGTLRAAQGQQPQLARLRMAGQSDIPTTGRPAPRPQNPMRDPMRGVDVFTNKFPDEMRNGIAEVIERNGGFEAQRRGSMPQEQVARLAEGIAVDLSRRIKPGTALNTEAIRAHVDALAGVQSKINDLTARIARGQNTDSDILALEAARAELSTLAASVMGARSEAGRSLAQWKMLARVLQTPNPHLHAEAARALRDDAARFAAEFAQQPNDPLARFKWLQSQNTPSRMERLRQYYLANILSGVKTHERNAIGNLANTITELAVHPLAAGVDAARSAITGQPRTVLLSEMPSRIAGGLYGLQEGIREALFSARYGVNRSALTQSLSAAEAGKLDVPRVEFGGGGANPLNWPGRALDSTDQFFRAIARNMERAGLAHAYAKREGLTGERFNERVAELLAGVGDDGQRILERADAYARRAVFQEKAGPIVGHLQALVKEYPPLSFVMPFIRTPANILRQGAEFSAAGFGMKAARTGGREGAQALARASAGTIAAGGLAYLAATGKLSGSGPSDPIERAQLMESGWRPNSVKIGDQWVNIALFQPVSVQAMVVANAFEAWRASGAKDADSGTKAVAAAVKSLRSMLDLSFLSGVADLFQALESPSVMGATTKVAGRIASGFVPFSGAQRTITHAVDPVVRKPGGGVEQVMTGIPGLSDNVPARINRFGQDVVRPGGPMKRAADPFEVSSVNDDPVLAELGRLKIRMGMPSGRMGGVELDRQQQLKLQKLKGSAAYSLLSKVVNAPGYQRLSDERKAEVLERAIDRARGQVQGAARKQLRGRFRMRGAQQ